MWDDYIDQIILARRTSHQETVKQTPFKLLYGIEARMPGDFKRPIFVDKNNTERVQEYRTSELEALDQMRAAALKRAHLNALRRKLYFDMKVIQTNYNIGDPVLLAKGNSCKSETELTGPFKIINTCDFGTMQLLEAEGYV